MGCLCLATATRCASGARAGSSVPPTRHAHRHHRRHAPAACEGASESLVRVDGVGAPLPFSALGAGLDGEELDGLAAPGDFYELLGLDAGAACSDADVKAAYRRLQKLVHPDLAGECAEELSTVLNAAASLMADAAFRERYAASCRQMREVRATGFTGRPLSTFAAGQEGRRQAIFVDETQCIGCMQCTYSAPDTFGLDDGRAKVQTQWADEPESIAEAIDLCPTDCIVTVERSALALLEFVMRGCEREDIAILRRRLSGNMAASPGRNSPFQRAAEFARMRRRKAGGGGDAYDPGAGVASDAVADGELAEHAAGIARAFLKLPPELRAEGWPQISA